MDPLGPASAALLIFGGCCSNVFALEGIIGTAPDSGLLITFAQFLLTASAAYITQLAPGRGTGASSSLPSPPLSTWARISALHFGINILNNWAFAYAISLPVHIILRSTGSVWSMLVGAARGKRYSRLQVGSVLLLTAGVLVSAWAESQAKGRSLSLRSDDASAGPKFSTGLAILLAAQALSAYMGVYIEDTYATFAGANWTATLFYSHFLSLPLFLPLAGPLRRQYTQLAESPRDQLLLATNAVTQLACIAGVNLLGAQASAVTVTVVLNVRKLVSFVLSTWLFGHRLGAAMAAGAALVFGSGALYGWETSWRLPRARSRARSRAT